jgi:hypothetical protein
MRPRSSRGSRPRSSSAQPVREERRSCGLHSSDLRVSRESERRYGASRSSAIMSASRRRVVDSASSAPLRRPSDDFGTAKRLSQLTTDSRARPSRRPTGTSVGRSRIVPVTAATVTFARTGIARSRVRITTERRPPGSSTSWISPRFRAACRPRPRRRQRVRRVRVRQPTRPAGAAYIPWRTPRRSRAPALREG